MISLKTVVTFLVSLIILTLLTVYNMVFRREDGKGVISISRTSVWDTLSWLTPPVKVKSTKIDREIDREIDHLLSNDEELAILFNEGITDDIPYYFYKNIAAISELSPANSDLLLHELLKRCHKLNNEKYVQHRKEREEFFVKLGDINKGSSGLALEVVDLLPVESALKRKSVRISANEPEIKIIKHKSREQHFKVGDQGVRKSEKMFSLKVVITIVAGAITLIAFSALSSIYNLSKTEEKALLATKSKTRDFNPRVDHVKINGKTEIEREADELISKDEYLKLFVDEWELIDIESHIKKDPTITESKAKALIFELQKRSINQRSNWLAGLVKSKERYRPTLRRIVNESKRRDVDLFSFNGKGFEKRKTMAPIEESLKKKSVIISPDLPQIKTFAVDSEAEDINSETNSK